MPILLVSRTLWCYLALGVASQAMKTCLRSLQEPEKQEGLFSFILNCCPEVSRSVQTCTPKSMDCLTLEQSSAKL